MSEWSGVLFYVKDLCIHGCSSFVREVHTDMEQLTFFILFKQREETRPYCSHISDHTSFLQQDCEENKKIQEDVVYFCFYLKGGTLGAFDAFPEQ